MNTEEKVIAVLQQVSGMEQILGESRLTDDLGLNSLRMVELVLRLEDALKIEFRQSDLNFYKMQTVANLTELVRKYIG